MRPSEDRCCYAAELLMQLVCVHSNEPPEIIHMDIPTGIKTEGSAN